MSEIKNYLISLIILTTLWTNSNAIANPNGFMVEPGSTVIDNPLMCFDQEGREVLAGKLSKGIACCKQADDCFKRSQQIIKGGVDVESNIGNLIVGIIIGFAVGAAVVQFSKGGN